MTTERNLASVSQSWFKLSHSASESKHKNVKKYIHCIISPINNVECEYIVKKVVYYPLYPLDIMGNIHNIQYMYTIYVYNICIQYIIYVYIGGLASQEQ